MAWDDPAQARQESLLLASHEMRVLAVFALHKMGGQQLPLHPIGLASHKMNRSQQPHPVQGGHELLPQS